MHLKKWTPRLLSWLIIIGLSGSVIVACGPSGEDRDSDQDVDKNEDRAADKKKKKPAEPAGEMELTIVASGNTMAEIQFDHDEITVPANTLIHLTLVNKSEAAGMDHNFVVVKPKHLDDVVMEGLQAGHDKDFIPEGHEGLLAASPLAHPGETVEFEFISPKKPGNYKFICLYPGHVEAMQGKFIVVKADDAAKAPADEDAEEAIDDEAGENEEKVEDDNEEESLS